MAVRFRLLCISVRRTANASCCVVTRYLNGLCDILRSAATQCKMARNRLKSAEVTLVGVRPPRHHLSFLLSVLYERGADPPNSSGTNTVQPASILFSIRWLFPALLLTSPKLRLGPARLRPITECAADHRSAKSSVISVRPAWKAPRPTQFLGDSKYSGCARPNRASEPYHLIHFLRKRASSLAC